MTHCNILNAKLCNLQLNKLKSGKKMVPKKLCKISSNAVGDSNDENNFPNKLLLTNAQFLRLSKDFANNPSAKIKLSKTQLYRVVKSGRFLSKTLPPLPFKLFEKFQKVWTGVGCVFVTFNLYLFDIVWEILRVLQLWEVRQWLFCWKHLKNFRKRIFLYKFHIFCILAVLQYFDEKITFDDKVI